MKYTRRRTLASTHREQSSREVIKVSGGDKERKDDQGRDTDRDKKKKH